LRVEPVWHSFKHSIDIQPVFLRKDERIAAHLTVCMITYLVERWAEIRSGKSFRQIRHQLRTVHATGLIQGDQRLWKPNRLAPAQQALLQKLDIPPPKTVDPEQSLNYNNNMGKVGPQTGRYHMLHGRWGK